MKLPRVESLYMGFTFSLLWVVKFGRASVTKTRWRDISAGLESELQCPVKCYVLPVPVLFAQKMENLIAWVYGRWKYGKLKHCTGRTEFYQFPNLICAVLVGVWCWYSGRADWFDKAMIMLIIPIPIDAALIVIAIAAAQYLALGGVIWGLVWFILN